MRIDQSGYDAAISSKEEDLLGRWGFAQEIFTLATSCPEDWSVRVAIYGDWGTGKTSVLRFVGRMALDAKHVVVWFNPWGAKDVATIWREFVRGLLTSIRESPLGPDVGRLRFLSKARGFADVVSRLSRATAQTEKAVGTGLGFLDHWLKANRDDLREISDYFKGHRIVVLVDDLDRASPAIVPEVLHALKEILDIPGFSFVLGFDRDRVGAVLAKYHPGWGSGLDFLDKIVDFPRWLPSASRKDLLFLAERELKQYASFVDLDSFRQIAHHMPSNPRSLRKFVQGLWSLHREVKRYAPEELDWTLILLLALFRAQWPVPSEQILRDEVISRLLSLERGGLVRSSEVNEEKSHSEIENEVGRSGIPDSKGQERAVLLLREILQTVGFRSAGDVVHYAFLAERPLPLTQREFEGLYGSWEKDSRAIVVSQWVMTHSLRFVQTPANVWGEIFRKSIDSYHGNLSAAADSKDNDGLVLYVRRATQWLRFIEVVSMELGGFSGERPVYGHEHFGLLVSLAKRWMNFRNHQLYRSLREQEQRLVLRVASGGMLDPVKVWELIGPYGGWRHTWIDGGDEKAFLQKVGAVFVPRIAERILLAFGRQYGMRSVLYDQGSSVEREMLLDGSSSLWSGEFRSKLLEIAGQAEGSSVIHENVVTLFMCIGHNVRQGDKRSLVSEQEVLLLLWRGTIARRLNPRMAGTIEQIRQEIELVMGYKLEIPSWWQEVLSSQPAPDLDV